MRAFHEIRRPSSDDKYGVTAFRTQNLSFMAHWHRDIELIFVLTGEITVGVGGKVCCMKGGDLAIIGSGEIHYYDGSPCGCDTFVIIIPPQFLNQGRWPLGSHFKTPFFSSGHNSNAVERLSVQETVTYVSPENMSALHGLFMDIYHEVSTKDAAHEDMLRGRIHIFCGSAIRILPLSESSNSGELRRLEKVIRMQDALKWMDENFLFDVTLRDLAKYMNTSYHHLSRNFSEVAGTTFSKHLTRLRIGEADRLLAESTQSVTEIALCCGFNSLRTFHRAYRSLRDKAPSAGR